MRECVGFNGPISQPRPYRALSILMRGSAIDESSRLVLRDSPSHRNRSAVNQFGVFTAQEENHTGNLTGLWPFREIGVRHSLAVRCRVNDAGKDRVCADTTTLQVRCQRIDHGHRRLLGGDNLDFALARCVEEKLKDVKLTLRQHHALRRTCCASKEQLLNDPSLERVPVTILGSGRAVVGDALSTYLTRGSPRGSEERLLTSHGTSQDAGNSKGRQDCASSDYPTPAIRPSPSTLLHF